MEFNRQVRAGLRRVGQPRHMRRRRAAILRLRQRGWTLLRIGRRYGLTKERVRQIIAYG